MNKDPYGEKKSAKQKGGKVQPNSGRSRLPTSKGDFKAGKELFDRKETDGKSYSISIYDTWAKIRKEAITIGRNPALEIFFRQARTTLIIIEEERYRELIAAEEDGEGKAEGSSVGERLRGDKEGVTDILSSLKSKNHK
jgi:hypothetical protein